MRRSASAPGSDTARAGRCGWWREDHVDQFGGPLRGKPVLVVNGDDDTMLPRSSSLHLAQLLPDAQLSIYPDSGHGGIFQHHDLFVAQALEFLRD